MTTAMTKIEQIAKAIYERRNGARCHPWSKQPNSHQEPYLMDAEAALEAMREPTMAMEDSGFDVYRVSGYVGEIYRVMIDAALNEKEQG